MNPLLHIIPSCIGRHDRKQLSAIDISLCLQWEPSHRGYLQFLAESQVVYTTLDSIIAEAEHPECERLLTHTLLPAACTNQSDYIHGAHAA